MLFAAEVRVRARAQEALLAARGAAVSAAAALLGPELVAEHQLRQLEPQHQLRQRGRPQLWPGAAGQQKVALTNPAIESASISQVLEFLNTEHTIFI